MIKIINSFGFGLMLILPLDFLFFIGLKKHYFDFYKIDVFFNIYFFDNQPFLWICLTSLVFGFLVLYTPLRKILEVLYIMVLLFCFAMLFKPIAGEIGEDIFMKKNLTCKLRNQEFKADLLYEGRKNYFLKREKITKTIKIPKNKLKISKN